LKRLSLRILLVNFSFIIVFHVSEACGTGLYLNLPSFFSIVDTSRTHLTIRQADLQRDVGRASILEGELAFRLEDRTLVRLGLLYPAVQQQWDVSYGVGDGFIRGTVRVLGDTLEVSGLYLLSEIRIPIGSKSQVPFSFGSLDGGAGLELRRRTSLFRLRMAANYTLVGERQKVGSFINRNFLLTAFSLEFDMRKSTSFCFSGFRVDYRGGGSREVYLITLKQKLAEALELQASGALGSGSNEERIFDSILSLGLVYGFSPLEDVNNSK
jgi:hypothetical protein